MKSTPIVVKICGLATPEAVEATIAAGADRIGFVFFARSPRNVSLSVARELASQAKRSLEVVALTVDADDGLFADIVTAIRPDWLQLHGSEPPSRVQGVSYRFGIPVIKALGVSCREDVAQAESYAGVAREVLFDAKPLPDAARPGGNGAAFDWTLLQAVRVPFMLSGGLSPENVAEALRLTGAPAVDVSSGVEGAPGVKDLSKIRAFVSAARGAALA